MKSISHVSDVFDSKPPITNRFGQSFPRNPFYTFTMAMVPKEIANGFVDSVNGFVINLGDAQVV